MKIFPFKTIREGQKKLVADVETALREGKSLIANAPSGVGKTAATVSPALEYAMENDKVVFFLTPRHSQHRIVVDTLRLIKKRFNLKFNVVDIIGKKWFCPIPAIDSLTTSEFNDYCATVRREEKCVFYNRTRKSGGELTDGAMEVLERIDKPLHAEELKEMAKGFCPYEIALELAKRSRVVICDYYHIFSPIRNAVLSRIKRDLEDLILIVDEAHNLPDRIRGVLSSQITSRSLELAKKEAHVFGFQELSDKVGMLIDEIKNLARDLRRDEEKYIKKEELVEAVHRVEDYDSFIEELEGAAVQVREKRKKSYLGSLSRFLDMWTGEDVGYTRILRKEKYRDSSRIVIKYSCLDPAIISKEIFDNVHSTILMSGTLSPMRMYRDVLGLSEETMMNKYKSYFPDKNRLNLIIPDVTTQYTKRTEENYGKISDYITRISEVVNGRIAVFFPSYEMRDDILKMVDLERKIFVERPDMNKEEKARMFQEFLKHEDSILFGAQSGSFSEGVDFTGLKTVIVVGLALSKPDLETKSLIDYYDYRFRRGWQYGYIYPAVNRALQSAGRCIRSEKDRAIVVFMDKRFLWKNYRIVFPTDFDFKITRKPEEHIKKFFER